MKLFLAVLLLVLSYGCVHNKKHDHGFEFKTANASATEKQTVNVLKDLLGRFNPTRYYFTKTVMVDDKAIPHSQPVLTLHSRYRDEEDRLLALFLHEQIHWLEESKAPEFRNAMNEFARRYPDAPTTFPEAAGSVQSTYRHFIVNYLELKALEKLIGRPRAEAVFRTSRVYTWIYAKILSDEAEVAQILKKHDLLIEPEI